MLDIEKEDEDRKKVETSRKIIKSKEAATKRKTVVTSGDITAMRSESQFQEEETVTFYNDDAFNLMMTPFQGNGNGGRVHDIEVSQKKLLDDTYDLLKQMP